MKINYTFNNGENLEVEVNEEIANIILASRRKEHANNERHRYRSAFSIDAAEYEDKEYFCTDDDLADDIIEDEFEIKRKELLSHLTLTQRRRFEKYEFGMSIADIARSENASFNSVKESIEAAQKKLKKFFLIF